MKKSYQTVSATLRFKSTYCKFRFRLKGLIKRATDIIFASLALLLLSPLLGVISALIKIDSSGSIFFKQQRVGRNGRLFDMWKFRSMIVDAEAVREDLEKHNEMQNGVLFKMKLDPRITRVGAFVRKASIDELPQLLNVIKGDMSLVGPRPPLPAEVEAYSRSDHARLSVLPGITCLWQVQGRSDIPFDKQVKLDVEYIETQSFLVDFCLLLKTIPAVLSARGAY